MFGRLTAAVNCAGTGIAKRTITKKGPHPLNEFHRVLEVNTVGTFNVIRLVATAMAEQEPYSNSGERGKRSDLPQIHASFSAVTRRETVVCTFYYCFPDLCPFPASMVCFYPHRKQWRNNYSLSFDDSCLPNFCLFRCIMIMVTRPHSLSPKNDSALDLSTLAQLCN